MVKLKQYNPNKPTKYGLLYRDISDSVVPCTYFTLPYAGKPEIEGSEFDVTCIDEHSVYLVDKLSSHVEITGRNVSVDRYFSGVTIAHYLKKKNDVSRNNEGKYTIYSQKTCGNAKSR